MKMKLQLFCRLYNTTFYDTNFKLLLTLLQLVGPTKSEFEVSKVRNAHVLFWYLGSQNYLNSV
jgi:hypothetical protein